MIQKTLGIDLGTSSLGLAVRNTDLGGNIIDQLEYYSSTIFKSGVGNGKTGEYSYAAERTKYRSTRRLYQARKYRIWATLRLLIAHGCCPLTDEQLDRWAKYDKAKGLKRQYPVDVTEFEQWVRLDFDCDGKPEYSSPYQLRAELTKHQLDWSNQTDRYKFGRAMYHIAQRRGFKSSKGETLKDANENDDVSSIDISTEMKKSEEKKSKNLNEYMELLHLSTIGCAFYQMECDGIRVRDNSEYQAVQLQYQQEVKHICEFQHIDTIAPALYTGLISTKQGEGTIFYRRPLRSQKSNVGKCTLEPNHRRCPQSHPDFEEFRALSFINNIKYRTDPTGEWVSLTDSERMELFEKLFTHSKATFKFEDIRKWLENRYSGIRFSYDEHTINYRDHTTVAGCPVISRLREILGDEWRTATISTSKTRVNRKTGEVHSVSYNYVDLWHLAYSSDDYEQLSEFAKVQMHLDDKQTGELTRMWSAIQEGYTSLSLKAIRNILPLLRQGLIYSEAVVLAKIPDIIGHDRWENVKDTLLLEYTHLTEQTNRTRLVYNIANTLIANYKSRTIDEQQGFKDIHYTLDETDFNEVNKCIINTLSEKRWNDMPVEKQRRLQQDIAQLYQQFFASSERDYYKVPRWGDTLKQHLAVLFPDIPAQNWDKLYHHSQIDKFPQQHDSNNNLTLGTPDIGSIKNPVALRALHVLRRAVNGLLQEGIIDESTRVVVETAREMNDANWRWAIENYQKLREKENQSIAEIIKEYRPNYTDDDIEKGRLLFEQSIIQASTRQEREKAESFALDMQKHKLWKEQKFQCLYSGKYIKVKDLFDNNVTQIEHTVPRSISFDNSLTNKTVCLTQANREKNNRIPSELPHYDEILNRIKPWQEYLNHIKAQIELWKGKSHTATTVERKNTCIRQKHLWELERDYWQAKVRTFTIQKDEIDQGFLNSQLVDTRIITKYAFHYLKSVFSRVDVEKGSVTADFRKILGIQSADEKKDRSKHSHHAIDAAVLTMIPMSAQRDRMIELFYQCDETKGWEHDLIRSKLDNEIASCHIGSINGLVETIENNILINHITKDQTLSPAKKPRYVNNKRKAGQWNQGDCIRGQINEATFLGAIKTADSSIAMVVRKPLKSLTENNLITIVDQRLRSQIERQVHKWMEEENIPFAKAIEKDIYMLDKDGNQITHDKNGRRISPIRHVRCKTANAEPITLKKQTYLSRAKHKQYYYTVNGENAYAAIYWDGIIGNPKTFEIRTLLDITEIIGTTHSITPQDCFPATKDNIKLYGIIRPGCRVLIFDKNELKKGESIDDLIIKLHDTEIYTLKNRLYIVRSFEKNGKTVLVFHNEARNDNELGRGSSMIDLSSPNPKDRVSIKTRYMLIEGFHFNIDNIGKLKFITHK